jgi:hypothetical protein
MKRIVFLAVITALSLSTCASSTPQSRSSEQDTANTSAVTLDEAITDIAAYFMERLPAASHVAITGFEAATEVH